MSLSIHFPVEYNYNMADDHYRGYIDSLKGMAVIAIILYHLSYFDDPGLPWPFWWITHNGDRGVQIFFVISGFLSYLSLDRLFEIPDNVTFERSAQWIKGRLIKLIPLYYLALVFSLITRSWSPMWLGNEGHVTSLNVLTHILLIHEFFPHFFNSILWVEWYLGALVLYLVMTPLLYKYANSLKRMILVLLFFEIVIIASQGLLMTYLPLENDHFVYYGYLKNHSPYSHLVVYSLGVVLGVLTHKNINSLKNPRFVSNAILVSLFIELIVLSAVDVKNINFFGLWSFLLILSQEIYSSPIIDNRFFRLIGKHSYVMYLFQFIFFNVYDMFIDVDGLAGWCLKGVICITLLLCFSCITNVIRTKFRKHFFSR